MKPRSLFLLSLIALSGCASLPVKHRTSGRSACTDLTVQVYFEPGSAEVSPEGRRVLGSAAQIARNCRVTSVDLIAPADAEGDPEVDMQLSNRRLEAVSAILTSAGLPAAKVPLAAPTPIRRRADVVVHLAQR